MSKRGLVLLPYLAADQLEGFSNTECQGVDADALEKEWLRMRSVGLPGASRDSDACEFEEMSEKEENDIFDHVTFDSYYKGKPVRKVWLTGYRSIVPLSPFIVVEDCVKHVKKLKSRKQVIDICIRPKSKSTANVSFQREERFSQFSLYTEDRNVRIRSIEFGQSEDTKEVQVTLKIGRSSPYIEVMCHEGRMYLLNGLHRLYSVCKAGLEEVPIPCVLIEGPESEKRLHEHPYEGDITRLEAPPVVDDFFREETSYEFPLRTGRRHIHLLTSESLLPD